MTKRLLTLVAAVAAMMLAAATVSFAGGPADKATGSGTWINSNGDQNMVDFNAHEAMDNRPAKGEFTQSRVVDGVVTGSFTVDVDTVEVVDGSACITGEIVAASGIWRERTGVWTSYVTDGGEPGIGVDKVSGNFDSDRSGALCDSGHTSDAFIGGNVQIHEGKGHQG